MDLKDNEIKVITCPNCNGTGQEEILSDERGDYMTTCYKCGGRRIVFTYINPLTKTQEYKKMPF